MKIISIHQPQYLPYLGFFHKIYHSDIFVFLDNVQFQKNGVQNRNKIKTKNGEIWLTVPVYHKFGQLINEVIINNKINWQKKHWKSIFYNYHKAPYFKEIEKELRKYLLDYRWEKLIDLNSSLTEWILNYLQIKRKIIFASSLPVEGRKTDLLVNICKYLNADAYLSGPGGKNYLEIEKFKKKKIKVIWQNFVHPVYPQQFMEKGFIPNLSIIDILFNCGKNTINYLK